MGPKELYNEVSDSKIKDPQSYDIPESKKIQLIFDYGIDLDENICYLDFSNTFDHFVKQLRTLLRYNRTNNLVIICNGKIQSINEVNTYISFISYITSNNKITISLYRRVTDIDVPTLDFFKKFNGPSYIIKSSVLALPEGWSVVEDIQTNYKNINLI